MVSRQFLLFILSSEALWTSVALLGRKGNAQQPGSINAEEGLESSSPQIAEQKPILFCQIVLVSSNNEKQGSFQPEERAFSGNFSSQGSNSADEEEEEDDDDDSIISGFGCLPLFRDLQHTRSHHLHQIFKLDLPQEILKDLTKKNKLVRVDHRPLLVSILGAALSEDTKSVMLSKDAALKDESFSSLLRTDFFPNIPYQNQVKSADSYRALSFSNSPTMGIRRMIVIRISTLDATPTATTEDLYSLIFGTNISLKMQFYHCSIGQLTWIPVGPGVVDLTIPINVTQVISPDSLVDAAIAHVQQHLGGGLTISLQRMTDNAIFCLPPGVGENPASAGVGSWRAQFRNDWCDSLSATMHETGHMLGLVHSNEYGKPYDDTTSYMGWAQKNNTWPLKCYNGPENWKLGWYAQRSIKIDLPLLYGVADVVYLAAFVDYALTPVGQYVLVNIANQFYLQYNRAKGFNIDTGQKANLVLVTQDLTSSTELLAGLNVTDQYAITNFSGSELSLIIEVCDQIPGNNINRPDVMIVSIAFNVSVCGLVGQHMPTGAPASRQPSIRPQPRSTSHPTRSVAPMASHTSDNFTETAIQMESVSDPPENLRGYVAISSPVAVETKTNPTNVKRHKAPESPSRSDRTGS